MNNTMNMLYKALMEKDVFDTDETDKAYGRFFKIGIKGRTPAQETEFDHELAKFSMVIEYRGFEVGFETAIDLLTNTKEINWR